MHAAAGATAPYTAPPQELVFLLDPSATAVRVVTVPATEAPRDVLLEIKSASGLTWEQLARIMGVSRRAVHMWLRANPMTADKEERVHDVRQVVLELAGRSQLETRSRLLDKHDGKSVFDLLVARQDQAASLLAKQRSSVATPAVLQRAGRRLTDEARAMRSPTISPLDLLESGSGSPEIRPARAKRARRTRRKADGR
jgi:transcriptional regulator with XRE-family HTH domain